MNILIDNKNKSPYGGNPPICWLKLNLWLISVISVDSTYEVPRMFFEPRDYGRIIQQFTKC